MIALGLLNEIAGVDKMPLRRRSLSRHRLRQRAMQQGYLPFSGNGEHGWIVNYPKRFEDTNLEAVIDVSGDPPVSSEDFEVQLQDRYFW